MFCCHRTDTFALGWKAIKAAGPGPVRSLEHPANPMTSSENKQRRKIISRL
jgi:hypothetical protein